MDFLVRAASNLVRGNATFRPLETEKTNPVTGVSAVRRLLEQASSAGSLIELDLASIV